MSKTNKPSSRVVDLVVDEDGTYRPKRVHIEKPKKVKNNALFMPTKERRPKYSIADTNADEFLSGIDVGLDFIDNVIPRVERFLRMRG